MALIKHSLIQLILLLSIERFLSLSLCANNYFRYAKPGLHGVYLTSPCLCCVVLSHMGALFDFTFQVVHPELSAADSPIPAQAKSAAVPDPQVRVPCVLWSELFYLKVWFGRCYISAQSKRTWWGLQGGSWFLTWTWSFVSRWVSVSKPPLLFEYCAASLYTKWNQQGLKVSSSIFASGRQVILALLTLNKHSFVNLKAPESLSPFHSLIVTLHGIYSCQEIIGGLLSKM